ncbi:MAG: hypothetical protein O2816_04955 [Planctomycetota bacterium]|nr:hypothetical protein [Planctomycetota bacterium]
MNTPAAISCRPQRSSSGLTEAPARLLDWCLDLAVRALLWLVDRYDPDARDPA